MTNNTLPTIEGWKNSGKTFNYKSHPIFYLEQGEGDPLLLIHGFPTASWDWHRIWAPLKERFRLIAPDMIGFGFSAKPEEYEYSITDQADLIESLLAFLEIPAVDILAHDYGDTVAQEMLARYNANINRADEHLVIRSTCFLNGGLFPESIRPRLIQRLLLTPIGPLLAGLINERSFRRSFLPLFGPDTRPSKEEMANFWSLVTHHNGRRIAHKIIRYMDERQQNRSRWVGALQTTTVPLRCIVGLEDPVSGAPMANRYRILVPDPDIITLEDIGHYPQIEDPQGVVNAYWEFIDHFSERIL